MTTQDIDTAQHVLDQLYERIRHQANTEIARLNKATKDTGMEFYEAIRTMQGSLYAHQRKIDKIKTLLTSAKKDLE